MIRFHRCGFYIFIVIIYNQGMYNRRDRYVKEYFPNEKHQPVPVGNEQDGGMNRVLGTFGLTMLGIGCIVGTGIFVLTGIAAAGQSSEKLQARLEKIGVSDWEPHANPVVLWDIFGEKGHPVRATVSDLGPLLLARLLNLNEVQSGVLNIIFRIADDRGLLLLTSKISAPSPSLSATTPKRSRISTAISAAPRSAPSSAGC